jgi:hypothetical protein
MEIQNSNVIENKPKPTKGMFDSRMQIRQPTQGRCTQQE